MAESKSSPNPPQPRHGKKSTPSQHDKRRRLERRNPKRKVTRQAKVPLVGLVAELALGMSRLLDARSAFRLPIVLAGAMLAGSRRTASRWFQAAGVADDWDRFYDLLPTIGRRCEVLLAPLLREIVRRFDPGPAGRWKIAIDDSPTRRFGRHVEGANVHHHPTPGPADGPWIFGHNWVCLALLMQHSAWGVIALPLLSLLYVRQIDLPRLKERYGWNFRTKHELALDLVRTVKAQLRASGSGTDLTVVADGAYFASNLVRPLMAEGITFVSRLRRDSKLFDLPPGPTGRRGRPRKYGKNSISLIKRAAAPKGWQSITYRSRGVEVTRQMKSLSATSLVTGGEIRVVIVRFDDGNWAPYFSTDITMTEREILETAADRWAIEESFQTVKEIWGAGEQQVRNLWSNIGCWNLNHWLVTLVELESWELPAEELVDRSDRSWDNPDRRPSHADRRRRIMRKMLENQYLADLPATPDGEIFRTRIVALLDLAA